MGLAIYLVGVIFAFIIMVLGAYINTDAVFSELGTVIVFSLLSWVTCLIFVLCIFYVLIYNILWDLTGPFLHL